MSARHTAVLTCGLIFFSCGGDASSPDERGASPTSECTSSSYASTCICENAERAVNACDLEWTVNDEDKCEDVVATCSEDGDRRRLAEYWECAEQDCHKQGGIGLECLGLLLDGLTPACAAKFFSP